MGDVVVLEAAQHMNYRVHLTNVGEELVAQPFSFGSAAHQPRNIHEGDAGGDDLLGTGHGCNLVQSRIRHCNFARVRLDGAERIVGGLSGRGARKRIEQRRFADIRQADDAAFETHDETILEVREELLRAMGERTEHRQALRELSRAPAASSAWRPSARFPEFSRLVVWGVPGGYGFAPSAIRPCFAPWACVPSQEACLRDRWAATARAASP